MNKFQNHPIALLALLLASVLYTGCMHSPAPSPVAASTPVMAAAPSGPDNLSNPGKPTNTLVAATATAKLPDTGGFIQRWIILEPIPCNGVVTQNGARATVKHEYFPDQLTVLPHDGDKVTVEDQSYTWHAVDTTRYNINLYHFGYFLNKPTSNVIFWALAIVNCPDDEPNVRLAIGSNAASVWWVNGEEVTGIYGDRQTVIDDGVSKRLTLKKGQNIVRVAVVNNGGATDFCARFLDENGNPLKNFTVTLPGSAN